MRGRDTRTQSLSNSLISFSYRVTVHRMWLPCSWELTDVKSMSQLERGDCLLRQSLAWVIDFAGPTLNPWSSFCCLKLQESGAAGERRSWPLDPSVPQLSSAVALVLYSRVWDHHGPSLRQRFSYPQLRMDTTSAFQRPNRTK